MIPNLHGRGGLFVAAFPLQVHELLRFGIEGGKLVHELAAAETNFVGHGLVSVLAGYLVDVPCRDWRRADQQAEQSEQQHSMSHCYSPTLAATSLAWAFPSPAA